MSQLTLKKSSVTGKVPIVGDLVYGELALNYADGKLYYRTAGDAISSIGGSAFDPANPGAIGGTTAAAGTFTTLSLTTPLALGSGGTGKSTAPAAMSSLMGFTTTVTTAGTTTLTNTSSFYQLFTGTLTQTIVLPDTTTLQAGWSFRINNSSSVALSVTTSSAVALLTSTLGAGVTYYFTCLAAPGDSNNTATAWRIGFTEANGVTGSGGNIVLANSPTITGSLNFTGSSTSNAFFGTAQTSGQMTLGSASQTGIIKIGQSTNSQPIQIGAGVTIASTSGTTTGSIAAGTATLTIGTVSGTAFSIGMAVTGTGVLPGTYITAGSGTSWTVNQTHTTAVTSVTITGTIQKSIDIGVNGVSGSFTQITLGSAVSGATSTTNINGTTKFGTNLANQLQVVGSATTSPVTLSVLGSDPNIDLTLAPKGTGRVIATTGIKTRVQSITVASGSTTQAWSSDSYDQINLTLSNTATVTLQLDTGTPTDGQKVMFRIKDDGTSHTIAFTSTGTNCFRNAGTSITLSSTATTASKLIYIGCIYNSSGTGTWDVVAFGQEA